MSSNANMWCAVHAVLSALTAEYDTPITSTWFIAVGVCVLLF